MRLQGQEKIMKKVAKIWNIDKKTTHNTVFTHFRASWFGLVHLPLFSSLRGIQPSSSLPKKA